MTKSLDIIDPKRDLAPREPDQDENEDEERPSRERSGGGVFYLVLGIIAVVVSTALAVYILFKDNKTDNKTAATPTATTTTTGTASASVTATGSAASSAVTTTATTAAGTFKYTNESIRIVNGNGRSGEATRIKTALEAKGYTIASTGNASKQYATTTILYKAGEQALADALKTALAADYSAVIELSDQATLGTYDAVIALGAK
jgi:hypothetical protein